MHRSATTRAQGALIVTKIPRRRVDHRVHAPRSARSDSGTWAKPQLARQRRAYLGCAFPMLESARELAFLFADQACVVVRNEGRLYVADKQGCLSRTEGPRVTRLHDLLE